LRRHRMRRRKRRTKRSDPPVTNVTLHCS
jgi:hypothetical protein